MKIKEVMATHPKLQTPHATLKEVAKEMMDLKTGIVPISDNDKLVGMVTDRDIAIRGIAQGKGPNTKVSEIMTNKVLYCFENDSVDDVLENMKEQCVQRMVVLDNEKSKHLVGMVSLSSIANAASSDYKMANSLAACESRDAIGAVCCA